MIRFTDDDLKRLKECLKSIGHLNLNAYTRSGQEWFDIQALLARLEAADDVIKMTIKYSDVLQSIVPLKETLEIYRKAEGK